ncbi:MAG: hypothetical protein M3Y49_20910 [Actinomycetota bacterium]|nr:hypothetical protein [Actinomycetota bacterium]
MSDKVSPYCTTTAFSPGTKHTIGPGHPYFIVAITPTQAGKVHIQGTDLTYWQGIRHGSQHAGIDITVTTP